MSQKMFSLAISAVAFAFVSCGGNSTGTNDSSSSTPLRESLPVAPCLATFKEPYTVTNFFGDELFTTNTTASYIVSELGFSLKLYWEMDDGLYEFEVESNADGSYPVEPVPNLVET